jgi:hypothetical protein
VKGAHNNDFSTGDEEGNKVEKLDGYLTTPSGTLKLFNYKTEKVTVISKDMPSDPKDPDRVNKIDP